MHKLASLTGMSTAESATPDAQQQAPAGPVGWTADASSFGARLALIRQHMGWGNIAKAAKECGLPTDSWRNWEVDGREPHRMVTIALTIATRVGCDYLWLVHGPGRGGAVEPATSQTVTEVNAGTPVLNGRYVGSRVIARIMAGEVSPALAGRNGSSGMGHAVDQTRPNVARFAQLADADRAGSIATLAPDRR